MVPVSGETKRESSNIDPVSSISDNDVDYGTDDTLPDISYKDAIDIIQYINDIIDHNILTSEDGEVIRAQLKALDELFDQDLEMFLVSLDNVQDNVIMAFNAIVKSLDMQLQRESKL